MSFNRDITRAYEVLREQGLKALTYKIGKRLAPDSPWGQYNYDAMIYASWLDFSLADVAKSQALMRANQGPLDVRTIAWFMPEFSHGYFGGILTLLRCADYLKRAHGIDSRFYVLGSRSKEELSTTIAGIFPSLAGMPVRAFHLAEEVERFEPSDVAIASLWATAYLMLYYNQTKRKFYFLQDYEPLFYPAGSISAQVEASMRFGYYGIANTPSIKHIYEDQYGGQAESFVPCVDTTLFHPGPDPRPASANRPIKIFFYARPGHPRNGFELGAQALRKLKKRLKDRVEIVAAGDAWTPSDYSLKGVVKNLGLLEYKATADLYRTCDIGLVMMFTRHPSYLPFELMASGSLVVTNYNPATAWLLEDGKNCRLTEATATCLADVLEDAINHPEVSQRITAQAVHQIQTEFSDWDCQLEKVYQYLCAPKG